MANPPPPLHLSFIVGTPHYFEKATNMEQGSVFAWKFNSQAI